MSGYDEFVGDCFDDFRDLVVEFGRGWMTLKEVYVGSVPISEPEVRVAWNEGKTCHVAGEALEGCLLVFKLVIVHFQIILEIRSNLSLGVVLAFGDPVLLGVQ